MGGRERDRLAEQHTPLVRAIVRRFSGRGVEYDDLFQLGMIGLLKAIDGFDSSLGHQFSTYAVPRIMGEIRRYLRDDGTVKVSRTLRERAAQVRRAQETYIKERGVEPGVQTLSAMTGLTAEEIAECESASCAVLSLDAPVGEEGGTLLEVQADSFGEERLLEQLALRAAIDKLEPLERQIVALRYGRDLTQQKTGEVLGLSQVKVSRMEKKIMEKLRGQLE